MTTTVNAGPKGGEVGEGRCRCRCRSVSLTHWHVGPREVATHLPDPRLRLRSRVVVTTATGGCASPRRDDQFGPALWLFLPGIRESRLEIHPEPARYRYLGGNCLMGVYLALIHVRSADLRQRLFVSDACLVLSCANLSWMILCSIVCWSTDWFVLYGT